VAFMATGLTSALAFIKMGIGYFFDSPILIADAIHSSADAIAILAAGAGLWLAGRNKSDTFPFGLYKAETLVSLVIGIIVLFGGYEIATDGISRLASHPKAQSLSGFPMFASLLSIIVTAYIAMERKNHWEVNQFQITSGECKRITV
jgi:cation diffusion facilitator family transporter